MKNGINLHTPVKHVKHADLSPADDGLFKSVCPECEDGMLLMQRTNDDPHYLMSSDRCTLCGQAFEYTDVQPESHMMPQRGGEDFTSMVDEMRKVYPMLAMAFEMTPEISLSAIEESEKKINERFPQGTKPLAPTTFIPFGFLLGEAVVRDFGGRWDAANKSSFFNIEVEVPTKFTKDGKTALFRIKPFQRVSKFWSDRTDSMSAMYRTVEIMTSMDINDPANKDRLPVPDEEGWMHWPHGVKIRQRRMDAALFDETSKEVEEMLHEYEPSEKSKTITDVMETIIHADLSGDGVGPDGAKGVYPHHLVFEKGDGLAIAALILPDPKEVCQAAMKFKADENLTSLVFTLDRNNREGQGIDMKYDSLVTIILLDEGVWKVGVLPYRSQTGEAGKVVWDNKFWNTAVRKELKALKIIKS